MRVKREFVFIPGTVVHDTEEAFLFESDIDDDKHWIPKSQAYERKNGISVTRWFADMKEIPYDETD